MPETHDLFLAREHFLHAATRFPGRIELLDKLHGGLVCSSVQRATQRADSAGNGGMKVRQGAGNDARGKRRGIEFMFGVQDQRGIERLPVQLRWRSIVQHVEKMSRDAVVVRFYVDALAVGVEPV